MLSSGRTAIGEASHCPTAPVEENIEGREIDEKDEGPARRAAQNRCARCGHAHPRQETRRQAIDPRHRQPRIDERKSRVVELRYFGRDSPAPGCGAS